MIANEFKANTTVIPSIMQKSPNCMQSIRVQTSALCISTNRDVKSIESINQNPASPTRDNFTTPSLPRHVLEQDNIIPREVFPSQLCSMCSGPFQEL